MSLSTRAVGFELEPLPDTAALDCAALVRVVFDCADLDFADLVFGALDFTDRAPTVLRWVDLVFDALDFADRAPTVLRWVDLVRVVLVGASWSHIAFNLAGSTFKVTTCDLVRFAGEIASCSTEGSVSAKERFLGTTPWKPTVPVGTAVVISSSCVADKPLMV